MVSVPLSTCWVVFFLIVRKFVIDDGPFCQRNDVFLCVCDGRAHTKKTATLLSDMHFVQNKFTNKPQTILIVSPPQFR